MDIQKSGSRRVKFQYMSPTDKQSYRNRFKARYDQANNDENHVNDENQQLNKNGSKSLYNLVESLRKSENGASSGTLEHGHGIGLSSINRVNTRLHFGSMINVGSVKSRLTLVEIARAHGLFDEPKPKPLSTYEKVDLFLNQNHFVHLQKIRDKGGISKLSGVDFYLVITFILDKFNPGVFCMAWKIKDRREKIAKLSETVVIVTKSIGLQISASRLKTPMMPKFVFEKFFSEMLKKAEARIAGSLPVENVAVPPVNI